MRPDKRRAIAVCFSMFDLLSELRIFDAWSSLMGRKRVVVFILEGYAGF
jgi:hypothetical protein